MAMGSCPRCGSKDGGFFKLCGLCEHTVNLLTESKAPKRVINEPDDDE